MHIIHILRDGAEACRVDVRPATCHDIIRASTLVLSRL
jgi:hypothetical protein